MLFYKNNIIYPDLLYITRFQPFLTYATLGSHLSSLPLPLTLSRETLLAEGRLDLRKVTNIGS
jgi:hypothetical protein